MAETYDMTVEEPGADSPLARWLIPAILVSLLLHGLFVYWARGYVVQEMSASHYDKIVPRTFRIERAYIDPKLLDPEPAEERSQAMAPQPVKIPEEKVAFERLMGEATGKVAAPAFPEVRLSETPSLPLTDMTATLDAARSAGAQSLLEDPAALTEAILNDVPVSAPQNLETAFAPEVFAGSPAAPEGALQGRNQPGFSNLDELLARTGPLSPETAPILMPTDLLFDYDSADLREVAVGGLSKLGTLMRRNPQSRFLIEGHTDSFGSDAYNLELSTRRAENVRAWLIEGMGIPANKIETRGFGESRLLAPSTGTIEEQQLNRRVEIVIRAGKGQ